MSQFAGAKLVKEIHFEKGQEGLISGIDKLARAVSSTLGASGRSVVIENDFGGAAITKDGVTVAESIQVQDPLENLGMTMLKQAAKQTAVKAGDGTTTSTLLAAALIAAYHTHKEDHSFRSIKKGIDKTVQYIVKQLNYKSVQVDKKRLKNVSIISCNGDLALGTLIAEAFEKASENGIVTHKASLSGETFIETRQGTHLNSTSTSHHFFTSPEKETAELENPLIFLCESSINNARRIQTILEYAIENNRSMLIIAPLESQPTSALAMNKVRGNFKVNVIEPPSFGLKRKDFLDDLAALTGAKVVSEELGDALDMITPDVLGSADRAVSDKEGTTIAFSHINKDALERIDTLKKALEHERNEILKNHLERRLALLTGGVATINVGAETEVEQKEKQDRVDDAIKAVKAARKQGILPGGGAAFLYIANNCKITLEGASEVAGFNMAIEAIKAPFNKILTNAGLAPKDYPDDLEWGQGVDVIDGKIKDMRKAGIIDPTLVAITALKNAASVATTILSTDAVISNVRAQ